MFLQRSLLGLALLVTPVLAAGCAAPSDEDAAEESGATGDALTSGVASGTHLKTTANLNLRAEASTSAEILRVMPKGTVVTALGQTKNGFFLVDSDGDEAWAYGKYLTPTSGSATTGGTAGGTDGTTSPTSGGTASGPVQTCKASFYAEGTQTASGERFDPNGLTAAHKTLPFNTRIKVTNTANGESVVVRINDRGPFVAGRCLDLARGAFTRIASTSAGVATVSFQVVN
jgi:rare lipoprotein A